MDVAFVCLSVSWYALIPKQTSVVRDARSPLRTQLMEGSGVELDVRGSDSVPGVKRNPFVDADDDTMSRA